MNPVTSGPRAHRTPPRTRTASTDVRAALVNAAERLLEAEGPDALAVRRIALEAGVAPMGVYNHFGSKQGIVDELFQRGFDTLRDTFADIDRTDARAALVESGLQYRALALRRPRTYGVMFDRAVADYEPSPAAREHAQASFAELVALVQHGMDEGVIRADDATDAAQQMWSACHGAVSLELRGLGFVDDRDAHHRRLVETMLRGLSTPRAT